MASREKGAQPRSQGPGATRRRGLTAADKAVPKRGDNRRRGVPVEGGAQASERLDPTIAGARSEIVEISTRTRTSLAAPSAARATASGSPDGSSTSADQARLALQRLGQDGDEPGWLTRDGRELEFIKRGRIERRRTRRTRQLHALYGQQDFDPLFRLRMQEERRHLRPDRPALEQRLDHAVVIGVVGALPAEAEKLRQRRGVELSGAVAGKRNQDVEIIAFSQRAHERCIEILALGDRDGSPAAARRGQAEVSCR